MTAQPRSFYSFDDYLEGERAAERECRDERHEYFDGEVFAMTGASWEHNLITANLSGECMRGSRGALDQTRVLDAIDCTIPLAEIYAKVDLHRGGD